MTLPTEREFTDIYILSNMEPEQQSEPYTTAYFGDNKAGDVLEVISFQTEPLNLDKTGWIRTNDATNGIRYRETTTIKDKQTLIQALNIDNVLTAYAVPGANDKIYIKNLAGVNTTFTFSPNIAEHICIKGKPVHEIYLTLAGATGEAIFDVVLFDTLYFQVQCDCINQVQGNVSPHVICLTGIDGKFSSKVSGDVHYEFFRHPHPATFTLMDDSGRKISRDFTLEIKTIRKEFFRDHPEMRHIKKPYYIDMRKSSEQKWEHTDEPFTKVCLQQIISRASPVESEWGWIPAQPPSGYRLVSGAIPEVEYEKHDYAGGTTTIKICYYKGGGTNTYDVRPYTHGVGEHISGFKGYKKAVPMSTCPQLLFVSPVSSSNSNVKLETLQVNEYIDEYYFTYIANHINFLWGDKGIRADVISDADFAGYPDPHHLEVYQTDIAETDIQHLYYFEINGPYTGKVQRFYGPGSQWTTHSNNYTDSEIQIISENLYVLSLLSSGVSPFLTYYTFLQEQTLVDDPNNPQTIENQPSNLLAAVWAERFKQTQDPNYVKKFDWETGTYVFQDINLTLRCDGSMEAWLSNYFDGSSDQIGHMNENSAWDHYLLVPPGMPIFYGKDWANYMIIIEPRNLTLFKGTFNDMTYTEFTFNIRDNPFAPGTYDATPFDVFYYDDKQIETVKVPLYFPNTLERFKQETAQVFKWYTGDTYTHPFAPQQDGVVCVGILKDAQSQALLGCGEIQYRKVLNAAQINNVAELTTYLWQWHEALEAPIFGGMSYYGWTPMIGWHLMENPEEEWFISYALWDEMLRLGYVVRTQGAWYDFTYTVPDNWLPILETHQWPYDRIKLQLIEQAPSELSQWQDGITKVDEPNPWRLPDPPQSTGEAGIEKLLVLGTTEDIKLRINFRSQAETFTLTQTQQDTLEQAVNNSRLVWHKLNPAWKYMFQIKLEKFIKDKGISTASPLSQADMAVILRLCFK